MNWLNELHDEMAAHGLAPDDPLITDGVIHRFDVDGEKRGRKSGWYVVHADARPTAVFGSWKTGEQFTWHADRDAIPATERSNYDEIRRAKQRRQTDRRDAQRAAADRAADMWARATKPSPAHPYLRSKQIGAYDVRQLGPMLLVPMRDADGHLISLQTIRGDGTKRFLRGGRVSGLFHTVGQRTNRIWLCEGYATAVSLHIDTGECVVVAFSAGNLLNVAKAVKYAWRPGEIVVMADDDWQTDGNPGVSAAKVVAEKIGCRWFKPEFPTDRPPWATDFNDAQRVWAEQRASA
tara:strand:+ start:1385 stop:2263 length:879 start_codon:yes stop_codon:yes gene_type:complete